jgi:signal transduction histidine kinase
VFPARWRWRTRARILYEHTLAQAVESLSPAIAAGLVVPVEPSVFRFTHDRVQQAAHELVAPEKRGAVHLKIGRLLLTRLSPAERQERIFELVQQFNQAVELVQEPAEREQLAELNLQAAIRARAAAAHAPAAAWLRLGRSLLRPDAWMTQYPLALGLHCAGADVARLVTAFQEMDALARTVMANARAVLDSLPVYETLIEYHTAQNRPSQALELAREVLARLGVSLPARPTPVHVFTSLLATMRRMRGRRVSELSTLPLMENPTTLGAMRVLMRTISAAYIASPHMFPLIVFQMVRLSLKHGNSAQSPFGYVIYGIILSASMNKHEEGYELGQFSLELMGRFQSFASKAKLYVSNHVSLNYWKHHLRDSLEPLREAFHSGMETGDVEYACHGAMMYSHYLVVVGDSLEVVQRRQEEFLAAIEKNKSEFHAIYTRVFQQFVLCLRGMGEPPRLAGSAFQEERDIPRLVAAKNFTALFSALHCKAQLCYLHGDPRGALEHSTSARAHEHAVTGSINPLENVFIQSLALLACHPRTNFRQRRTLAANRRKLRGWARQSTINFGHKHLLVEAELARVTGRHTEASVLYEKAITAALEARFIQVAAMALELSGRHHLALGMSRSGWRALTEAWRTYQGWGALHKANALEAELKSAGVLAGLQEEPRPSGQSLAQQPASIDLATILNASRAISQEIVLESLLRKLVRLLIENAGAERGVLILENDGQLAVEVESPVGEEDTTRAARLSLSILNYVVRTGESVVLHDATKQGLFTSDEYVLQRKPRSVLCAPLLNQGRLVAISVGLVEMAVSNISRVFINIIDNALYALEEKQGLAGPGYVPSLHIRTKELGPWCEIRIRDNGTGIPQEVADKIFNPFFTTKPAGRGTGLGLSLSHDIVVQGHQGELRVETVPGESTEFIIRLPKKLPEARGEQGAA